MNQNHNINHLDDWEISVVIPLYNDKENIIFCVNSVLQQSYPPKEIIIVDDGSIDGSYEVVKEHYLTEKKIKIIRAQHGGISGARNKGLKEVTSNWVAFLDSDDIWQEDKLEKQIEFLKKNEDYRLIYCGYQNIDAQGNLTTDSVFNMPTLSGDVFSRLLMGNLITGSASAVMVNLPVLRSVGGFDEECLFCEDWDMWLRLASKTKFGYINESLVLVRQKNKPQRERYFILINKYKHHLRIWSKWSNEVVQHQAVCELIRTRFFLEPAIRSNISIKRRIATLKIMQNNLKPFIKASIYKKATRSELSLYMEIFRFHFKEVILKKRIKIANLKKNLMKLMS